LSDDFQCKASLLPNDRLAMITMCAINIYAITNSSDEKFPELLLSYRVAVELHPRGISRPLVGHDGIFICICGREAKRTFISHNPTIPPTTEVLGPLKSSSGLETSYRQLGTMALFSFNNHHEVAMATYDLTSHLSHYRWLQLNILRISHNRAIVKDLAGLDDNVGRVVIRRSGSNNHFLVMDVI